MTPAAPIVAPLEAVRIHPVQSSTLIVDAPAAGAAVSAVCGQPEM